MTTVAIIPARGGSKRIPGKNLRLFNGVPMMAWSIRAAQRAGCFDRIVVSTDDPALAELALAEGAEVPFQRPAALADDHTGTLPVIAHALGALPEVTLACCLYATAPLVQAHYLNEGLRLLQAHPEKSYAFSVCSFSFPVQRALVLNEEGALDALYPQHRYTRSQDLPAAFQDAGQFYWGRRDAWLRGDTLFSPCSLPVKLPRYLVQDIDTEEDWRRAEFMYQALKAAGEVEP
ncbi:MULTISPECIES: pseudaminic acid cytidylyltransferase [Pseudomonas]|uniref:Pseudaminic acid cytidylyltransferase n=1 Tax=Pseudomonas quercus TaxID=2722792 RepID=A0ABX0YJJ6_9PSED|nr:pseudaminic acid cytidylyltransferase [Pseudomonas sp. LY10J]MBF7144576.1 pseudaminic acid cytidylyltransferase [Pseudomonas sp. LY10J]NJP03115.1 pseudaminic acid cytidylyltransferase [Pseudomonas quercus]